MFHVTVQQAFSAQVVHTIRTIERQQHHHYLMVARVEGPQLNEDDVLLDINLLDQAMKQLVSRWQGKLLNDLAEFRNLNPTLEQVARVACHELAQPLVGLPLTSLEVTLFENETASRPGPSAGYWLRLHGSRG